MKSTYELYAERYSEYFGDTITAVFNDETRMSHAFVWDKRIPELFKETYGYDIMECLYLLPLEGDVKRTFVRSKTKAGRSPAAKINP